MNALSLLAGFAVALAACVHPVKESSEFAPITDLESRAAKQIYAELLADAEIGFHGKARKIRPLVETEKDRQRALYASKSWGTSVDYFFASTHEALVLYPEVFTNEIVTSEPYYRFGISRVLLHSESRASVLVEYSYPNHIYVGVVRYGRVGEDWGRIGEEMLINAP